MHRPRGILLSAKTERIMHRQKGVWGKRGWRIDTEDIIPCTEEMRIYLFYKMTQVYHSRMLQLRVIQLLCTVGISTFFEEAQSQSD
jgi:hypothetical protein